MIPRAIGDGSLIPPDAEDVIAGDVGVEHFGGFVAFDPAEAARIPGAGQFVKLFAFYAAQDVERVDVPDVFGQIPKFDQTAAVHYCGVPEVGVGFEIADHLVRVEIIE